MAITERHGFDDTTTALLWTDTTWSWSASYWDWVRAWSMACGSPNRLSFPDTSNVEPWSNESFTARFAFKHTATTTFMAWFVTRSSAWTNTHISMYPWRSSAGQFWFQIEVSWSGNTCTASWVNTWYWNTVHWVRHIGDAKLRLYINGDLENEITLTVTGAIANVNTKRFGAIGSSNYYSGGIDEFKFDKWNWRSHWQVKTDYAFIKWFM